MSAVDEIQAAIEKLTALKAASTYGPWHQWTNDLTDRVEVWHDMEVRLWVADFGDDEPNALADADLVVTLHRTIDAQLEMLRDALARMTVEQNQAGIELHYRHPLALARAINGATK